MVAEVWISLCITLGVRRTLFGSGECLFSFPEHIKQSTISFLEETSMEYIDYRDWFSQDKLDKMCDAFFVEMEGGTTGLLFVGKDGSKNYYECSRCFSHETHQSEFKFSRALYSEEFLNVVNQKYDIERLRLALEDMVLLSRELDNMFRSRFESAIAALNGRVFESEEYSWLDSTVAKREVLIACIKSDLFGGMGSWFDSPLYLAEQRNMTDRFNMVSFKLKDEIRKSRIYVVNHSYTPDKTH